MENISTQVDELEKLNQELESLAFTISHDLRSPLRHIDAYSKLLKKNSEDELSDRGIDFLNKIIGANEELHSRLNTILNYSRIGRKSLEISQINPNDSIDKLIRSFDDEIQAKGAKLKVGELPMISTDEALFQQLLGHIISNALRFSSLDRSPLIEISSQTKKASVIFQIKDNGIGFEDQYTETLYSLFQVLHSANEAPVGQGTGLALSKRILDRLGGKIWARSHRYQGSEFFVELPYHLSLKSV